MPCERNTLSRSVLLKAPEWVFQVTPTQQPHDLFVCFFNDLLFLRTNYVPTSIISLTAQNSQSSDFIHFWQIWEKPTYSAMIPNLYTEYVTSYAFQAAALDTKLTYLRYSSIRSVSPRRLTLPIQSGRHGSWSVHKNHLLFIQSVVLSFVLPFSWQQGSRRCGAWKDWQFFSFWRWPSVAVELPLRLTRLT